MSLRRRITSGRDAKRRRWDRRAVALAWLPALVAVVAMAVALTASSTSASPLSASVGPREANVVSTRDGSGAATRDGSGSSARARFGVADRARFGSSARDGSGAADRDRTGSAARDRIGSAAGEPEAGTPGRGTWVCHDPDFPDPCHRRISAAGMATERLGWAVGEAGVIMRWDGRIWAPTGSPTRSDLHAIHVVSEHEAWAVGADSAIAVYDGATWSLLPYDRGRPLYGVFAAAPDDVWMVGSAGFILHWDGASFTVHTSGVTDDLHAVAMVPVEPRAPGDAAERAAVRADTRGARDASTISAARTTDGWIAGGNALLRWDGSEWRSAPQPPDTRHDIRDIQLTSPSSGWAVGRTILRLDGDVWREAVSSRDVNGQLNDLDLAQHLDTDLDLVLEAADDGWAVGGSRIWRLSGATWSVFADAYPEVLQGSAVTAPTQRRAGWLFSASDEAGLEMRRWSSQDGAWLLEASHLSRLVRAVGVVSNADAWRATWDGALEHWDGRSWFSADGGIPAGGDALWDIDALSNDVAWAVSPLSMLRWDGRQWSETRADSIFGPLSVAAVTQSDAWSVGANGLIARWDGAAWSSVDSPTILRLLAVDASSAGDAWAVGERGTIIHWDGTRWTMIESPTEAELRDVVAIAADSAWAVGGYTSREDALLRWDGRAWQQYSVPGPTPLRLGSVAANHESDVWAAGSGGGMVHWDGTAWTWHPAPTEWHIADLGFGDGAGWAGGADMLRYMPPPGPRALFVPHAAR